MRGGSQSTATPSVLVSHSQLQAGTASEHRSTRTILPEPASSMSNPSPSRDPSAPSQLLPPQHSDIDTEHSPSHHKPWDWFNKEYLNQHYKEIGGHGSVKPGSSMLGGKKSSPGATVIESVDHIDDQEIDPVRRESSIHVRRGSSMSTIGATRTISEHTPTSTQISDKDDVDAKLSNYRLHGERPLAQRSLDNSSQAYDRNLLSRIGSVGGGPNTPNRLSISVQGVDGNPVSPSAEVRPEHSRHHSTSTTSDRRQSSFDGSYRWPGNMPPPGTMSPGPFGFDPEHRQRHPSYPSDDNPSHRSSYDQSMYLGEGQLSNESGMRELNINSRNGSISEEYLKAGMKRRASSPHRDSGRDDRVSFSSASGGSDFYTRRISQQLSSRNSSISRYLPNHGSVSSASSHGPRNGSMASSVYGRSVASIASSATSYTSGRLSPGAISPAIDPDLTHLPAVIPKQDQQAPGDMAAPQPPRQDGPNLARVQHTSDPTQTCINELPKAVPNAQGMWMCECCPKKPKKFATEAELREHLLEKQYTCAYCPNRFKNKNEAERHQNSLHLRKHSWSCAALSSIETVFHPSATTHGATDMCGFCGAEFPNSPPDWAQRREHACQEHKFGECNQAKKFFRADHFRQHLKHSHGGLSGKWTNVLEALCIRDEPLPQTMAERASQMANSAAGVPAEGLPLGGGVAAAAQGVPPSILIGDRNR